MRPDRPSDPAQRFIDYGDAPLAYTDEGGGPALIAIPGLPGSVRDFRWLAPVLSTSMRVLRFDPPGYGSTGRTGFSGLTVAQRAEPVMALIEQLDLGPVTLAGHSAGAGVVAYLAAHRPELVTAAAMIAPAGPKRHLARKPMQFFSGALRLPGARRAMNPLIRRMYAMRGFPAYLTDEERAFSMVDALAFDFADYRADLVRMHCPTLVAWAYDDAIIPPTTFEALEAMVPEGPRLRFDDGGHSVQKAHAEQIGAAISDLVNL
ncbi:MAG: alpha/beta hydrolase [Candidatus Nanopelagicales bacterium]